MKPCDLCRKAATYGISGCRWHYRAPKQRRRPTPRSGYVGRGSYDNTAEGRHEDYVHGLVLRCDDLPECTFNCRCKPL